jgi:hypothetical protein
MQKILSICLILMMIIQFSGCAKTTSPATAPIATSTPPPVAPIADAGALSDQKTRSALRVGADPYYSNRQRSMFGQDMSQTGLLPVMVYLQNKGEQPLKVVPSTIFLEIQDGAGIQATPLPTDLSGARPPTPPPPDTTGAKVARVAAVTGLIALELVSRGLVSGVSNCIERDRQAKPHLQKEYQNKELREVTLAKGESAQGFVYFYVPQGIQQTTSAHLIVPYLPIQGRSGEVRVPLGRI